jgi:hypothetical protein
MRWHDAIELTQMLARTCRIEGLLTRTWGTHSLSSEGVVTHREDLTQYMRNRQMDEIAQIQLPRLFGRAEPYFVDRGLVELIERMGPSLQPETRLHPRLFPSRIGCLFYDRPINMPPRRLHDVPGRPDFPKYEPAPLSGFAWEMDARGALFVMFYAWSVDSANPNWFNGTYIGNIPLAVTPWDFGAATLGSHVAGHNRAIAHNPNEDDTNNAQRFTISAQTAVATLLLMNQQLTVSSSLPVDRPTRRRAQRAGWTQAPNVQVVTLRRIDYSHADHEPRSIDWSCRWLVREHWRTLDRGLDTERTILVHTYMKGPPDKPIKVPDQRVWAVVR